MLLFRFLQVVCVSFVIASGGNNIQSTLPLTEGSAEKYGDCAKVSSVGEPQSIHNALIDSHGESTTTKEADNDARKSSNGYSNEFMYFFALVPIGFVMSCVQIRPKRNQSLQTSRTVQPKDKQKWVESRADFKNSFAGIIGWSDSTPASSLHAYEVKRRARAAQDHMVYALEQSDVHLTPTSICIRDGLKGDELYTTKCRNCVHVDFCPVTKNLLVIVVHANQLVAQLWCIESGEMIRSVTLANTKDHLPVTSSYAMNHYGTRLAVHRTQRPTLTPTSVEVWDLGTGEQVCALEEALLTNCTSIRFSGNDQLLIAERDGDYAVVVFDAETGNKALEFKGMKHYSHMSFSADGRMCLQYGRHNGASVFDLTTGARLLRIRESGLEHCCFGVDDASVIGMARMARGRVPRRYFHDPDGYTMTAWNIFDGGSVIYQHESVASAYMSLYHVELCPSLGLLFAGAFCEVMNEGSVCVLQYDAATGKEIIGVKLQEEQEESAKEVDDHGHPIEIQPMSRENKIRLYTTRNVNILM